METELQSLHKNWVWELSELPPERKTIGSTWVFKQKHDADGNVGRYKARLVAQDYNQKYGIDYDETISWNSKKQTCVALSTTEAEYIALAKAAQESIWLQWLLMDMNKNSVDPITIFEYNQSTIAMTKNPQHHGKVKHIDIKFHYIREMVTMNKTELKYCKSDKMIADMLTKRIGKIQFTKLKSMIGLRNISDCEWGGVLKIESPARLLKNFHVKKNCVEHSYRTSWKILNIVMYKYRHK